MTGMENIRQGKSLTLKAPQKKKALCSLSLEQKQKKKNHAVPCVAAAGATMPSASALPTDLGFMRISTAVSAFVR